MKAIIIYKSNHGCTKQYAQWLSEEIKSDNFEVKTISNQKLEESDTVIAGGPVIAGHIKIASWIKSNWEKIKDKKIIVFSTSGALPDDPGLQEAFKRSFSEEKYQKKIKYIPLAGRYIFEKLGFFTKLMLKMASKMTKDNPEMKNLTKSVDNMDKKEIDKIIKAIK